MHVLATLSAIGVEILLHLILLLIGWFAGALDTPATCVVLVHGDMHPTNAVQHGMEKLVDVGVVVVHEVLSLRGGGFWHSRACFWFFFFVFFFLFNFGSIGQDLPVRGHVLLSGGWGRIIEITSWGFRW